MVKRLRDLFPLILAILVGASIVWAATYSADTAVNGLTNVGSSITSTTVVPIQDPAATGTLGSATVQNIVDKGLEAPGAIGGTTPAAGTFTTLSAGSGGFTVDSSGNVTTASVTVPATATGPQYSMFSETTINGSNYVGIGSPASNNNDLILLLPTSDPTAGQALVFGVPSSVTFSDGTARDAAQGSWKTLQGYHQTANFDPDNQYTNYSGVVVLDPYTSAAMTASAIHVYLNEAPTNEVSLTFYYKTAAVGYTGGTSIGSGTTTNGVLSLTPTTSIPAGSKIWVEVTSDPDATTTGCEVAFDATYD